MGLQTSADKSAKYTSAMSVFNEYLSHIQRLNIILMSWAEWDCKCRRRRQHTIKKNKKKNKYLFSNAAASDRQKVDNVTFNHRQMPSVCQVALCHGITDFLLCLLLLLLLLLLPDIIHMLDEGSSAFPGLISNRITSPQSIWLATKTFFPHAALSPQLESIFSRS